jgi:hypothetical protein
LEAVNLVSRGNQIFYNLVDIYLNAKLGRKTAKRGAAGRSVTDHSLVSHLTNSSPSPAHTFLQPHRAPRHGLQRAAGDGHLYEHAAPCRAHELELRWRCLETATSHEHAALCTCTQTGATIRRRRRNRRRLLTCCILQWQCQWGELAKIDPGAIGNPH